MSGERAGFMRGNYGLMSHWLQTPVSTEPKKGELSELAAEWNDRVDAFDVKTLAAQLDRVGAKWFILTIGQGSGFYCAPNSVYDGYVGYSLSKCSRRDLFFDLATELKKNGIKAIAYLPSGAPKFDPQAIEKLEWKDGMMVDEKGEIMRAQYGFRAYDRNHRLEKFQRKWETVVAAWAKAWGDLCAGWWIDGTFYADKMYKIEEEPNFHSLARSLRAGNPNAALAFNPGIQRMDAPFVQSDEEDYCTGELNSFLFTPFGKAKVPADIADGRIGNAQFHLLDFLGTNWGQGSAPRFPDDLIISWTNYILDNKGAVTWDLPTNTRGDISESFMKTLEKLSQSRRS
jgi:hypothetical protein